MLNFIRLMVAVFLVLSWSGLAYTQEPNPEPSRREVAPPPQPRQEVPGRDQEQTKPPRPPDEQKAPPAPGREQSPKPEQPQANPPREEHGRSAGQRGAGQTKSAHIPDPQFKAHFGRQHTFAANRVINQTTIVPGQTQFIMAGYTFVILDPWPTEWLFTDDCYVDYVGGDYFLFDEFHPGVRVALLVIS